MAQPLHPASQPASHPASQPVARVPERVERLVAASARRVVEPDTEVLGELGHGQVVGDDLLSVAGLDLELSEEQRRILSREEVASIVQMGLRFEAVLEAGFGAWIATRRDLTDPRITFVLHELGEETRHQRLFQRVLEQLEPRATSPIPFRLVQLGYRLVCHAAVRFPALFHVLVLAGEEIPDLFQRQAAEHPDTDPFLREVSRYHRMEEARHLSYARSVFAEVWADAGRVDRALVRHAAPRIVRVMFDTMVHPGVYEEVGLSGVPTWRAAHRSPARAALRHEATRPVLSVLLDSGAVRAGRVPSGWRRLCGVDRLGEPREPREPWEPRGAGGLAATPPATHAGISSHVLGREVEQ